jgi:hypothetical protein
MSTSAFGTSFIGTTTILIVAVGTTLSSNLASTAPDATIDFTLH